MPRKGIRALFYLHIAHCIACPDFLWGQRVAWCALPPPYYGAGTEWFSSRHILVQIGVTLVRMLPHVGERKSRPYFLGEFVLLFCCSNLILLTPCHCV